MKDKGNLSIAMVINSIKSVVACYKNDPKIYIYHYDTETKSEITYDKDTITAMDFCSAKQKFIFGHQSGKITFASY